MQFASLLLRPLAKLLLLGVTKLELQLDFKYLLLGGEEKTDTATTLHYRRDKSLGCSVFCESIA